LDAIARRREHRFFLAIAAWFLLATLAGFGPSIWFVSQEGPIALPFIVHGVVYFAWIVLFAVQTTLVSTGRVAVHRRMGVVGLVLLIAMVPIGFWPVLYKAAAGTKSVEGAGFNLVTLCLAFTFAFLGFARRRTPDLHKRFMMLATMVLSVAAADRVAFVVEFLAGLDDVRPFRKVLAIAPGLALLVFDLVNRRRVFVQAVVAVAVTWLVIWFVVSDLLFAADAGANVIHWLVDLYGL